MYLTIYMIVFFILLSVAALVGVVLAFRYKGISLGCFHRVAMYCFAVVDWTGYGCYLYHDSFTPGVYYQPICVDCSGHKHPGTDCNRYNGHAADVGIDLPHTTLAWDPGASLRPDCGCTTLSVLYRPAEKYI